MDKITVIVPVYNQENFLDECVLSIMNQTYKNLEIILVDDGSTDNSLEICRFYENLDKRIKVIHKENGGLPSARNAALDVAKGKYIMFCDSDDYYLPNSCELLLNEMIKRKADYVVGNYINCDEDGVLWNDPVFSQKEYKSFRLSINDYKKSFYIMSSSVCNKMFRRSFLKKYNMRFTEGVPAEDAIFTTYCFIKSTRIFYIKDIMYVYRQRTDSISWSQKHKSAASWFVCLLNICNYWLSHEFLAEEDKWISIYIEKICTTYKGYKEYQGNMESVGNYKERLMYDIVYDRYSSVVEFSDNQIERLKTSDMNIIYGAGKVASEVLKLMKKNEVSINYIAVTRAEDNATSMDGIEVKSIEELSNFKDGIVILGTDRKWHDEIISFLNTYDFENYIVPKFK